MLILALSISLLAAAVLALRLRVLARRLGQLARAIEARKSLLVEREDGFSRTFHLDRLTRACNDLLAENAAISQTEKSYLEQIKATLGSIREAVLIVDDDNQVLLANEALRQILNTSEMPLGRRLESLIQSSEFFEYVREVKAGSVSEHQEIEVRIGKQVVSFEVTGALLPHQEGEQRYTMFVLHDITNQKKLERVRTEFVANVSHELRTPVTIIKGFADTLVEDRAELSPEEQERFLIKIQKNTTRLHNLLEELLLLSRLESHQADVLKRERLSLNRLIAETADNFQTRLEANNQLLQMDLCDGQDVLFLDPLRITQVMNNLLENILRHAKGFRRIRIVTRPVERGVDAYVEDDGAGIPANDLPHIFERFYRVDKGRSRESGGTGLGLSIVKHIVMLHGGRVWADSQPGVSTRIGFFIPYPEALAEQAVLRFIRERQQPTAAAPASVP